MTQVLEYITQNYTLFLFGAIIILLAVIGYYAEKTNFGQSKVDKTKDEKRDNKEDLENTHLSDITNNTDVESHINVGNNTGNNAEELVQSESNINSDVENNKNINNNNLMIAETNLPENNENVTRLVQEKEEPVNPIIDAIHKELNLVSNDVIFNTEEIKNKETKNKKREEEFNKFSDEFDALLPKREIISDDLLSEIDDLELGKTQKFNLKDFKRFDNIKLPRISDTVTEDQDIWKF